MATITPVWTDNITVLATTSVAKLTTTKVTWDLRTKRGGRLFLRTGRTGTTALSNGMDIRINGTINNVAIQHPGSQISLLTQATAAVAPTLGGAAASGQAELILSAITSLAIGDYLVVSGNTVREEYVRISKLTIASGTGVTLDRNLLVSHNNADTVFNKADVFAPILLDGGVTWEIIWDYGNNAAGDNLLVMAYGQTYDSDLVA